VPRTDARTDISSRLVFNDTKHVCGASPAPFCALTAREANLDRDPLRRQQRHDTRRGDDAPGTYMSMRPSGTAAKPTSGIARPGLATRPSPP